MKSSSAYHLLVLNAFLWGIILNTGKFSKFSEFSFMYPNYHNTMCSATLQVCCSLSLIISSNTHLRFISFSSICFVLFNIHNAASWPRWFYLLIRQRQDLSNFSRKKTNALACPGLTYSTSETVDSLQLFYVFIARTFFNELLWIISESPMYPLLNTKPKLYRKFIHRKSLKIIIVHFLFS